jgi:tape measure domain-containing protein
MATLGSLTLKIRSTRNLLALDLLQCKQEVERFRETANDLLQLKTGVSIDWDSFSRAESEIRRWVDSLPTTNLRVGAKFVGTDLQDNIQQLERLLTNPLKIQVDDKRLFELNEHFKLKERDYKQLQSILDSPLSIKVDRSQLDNLSRDLQAIENTPQVNLRANIDLDALRTFHEQLKRYSQGRTLELATSVSRTTLNSLQDDLKAIASSLTTARVSVQIDSQLQALRSELGNLPNVTVGVSIDDSALGKFDRKLGNRKLGLGVDPSDIGNIDGQINKLGKKLDTLKPASGLFKAVTFAPTQIATGFLQGVGKNLSNGLGKGYSQGIEAALGDTIGSTELLGRKLAEGIANRSKSAISQLVPTAITDALRESINQALGETDVFVESRSRQAIQAKGQRKKKEQSREGVAEERRQAARDFEDRGFEVSALTTRSNQLERSYKANARVKNIVDDKIASRPEGSRSRAKLEAISATFDFDQNAITEEQIRVGKQLRSSKNAQENALQRVDRSNAVYQSLKPTQLPKAYRDAIADVPENLIPQLKADATLAQRGMDASYSAKLNRLKVSPEIYESMQNGLMSQDQFRVMYHEIQHGRDFKFGQFDGLVDRDNLEVRNPVKATAQEIKDVAPYISQYSPELRAVEQNAEISGRRGGKKAYERQQRQQLSAQLTNAYGLGGTTLDRIVDSQVTDAASRTVAIENFGANLGYQSPSAGKIVDRAITLRGRQKQIGLDIAKASNGELSSAEIEGLQARIDKQILGVEHLSQRIDALKQSIVKRVAKAKQSVPEPVETAIADPWATAKPEGIIIDRDKVVEVAATAGSALRKTLDTGKSIISNVRSGAANLTVGAKSGYGLMQQGEAMLMNASPQARLLKSQIQDNIADRIDNARYQIGSRVNQAGQFAGFLYNGLKETENSFLGGIRLGPVPLGHPAKSLIQASTAFSFAHSLPGVGSALDLASTGIGALSGMAGNILSSGASANASNFVAQSLGSIPFHESVVPAIQQGLGTALNASITSGVETATGVATPFVLGQATKKIGQKVLASGAKKILNSDEKLLKGNKLPALQPKAEPVYDYVEVVAEPVKAAASASQGSKPTPLNLTAKPKQPEIAPQPKLITQITESEAIDKAQKFATQFKKAQKAISKALDDGETQLAFEMGKKIEDYAKIARSEINNIAQLLGDRATSDTPLRDKLNSAKSQISRATNTGARAVTVYQNSNPVAGDELASLKIPKPEEIRDAATAKLAQLRNLFDNSQTQEPAPTPPLGRPRPLPNNSPVPPKNPPKRNLGSALPPPAQIVPELAARSQNPDDLIASIEQKLNFFEGVYPEAERQVRGSEKRGRKNVGKFMGFVGLHQDLFDSSFGRLDRESAKNLQEQQAKTQNLNDRVFTENGITPLGKDVDSLLPKLSDLKNMGANVISIFAGFAGVAFVGKMLADWGAGAFQAAAKMESLRTTIGAVSASNIKAQSTIARSTTESNKLGYNAVAGLENDAGFFASTRTTALELVAPDIMSGLKSYNRVMGVDENRAKLAQTAVVQMAGKGKINAEELFGQLAESSPGAVNVLSRSMGLSVGQLRKEMESGSLNANDVLPRFGNQLTAESLGTVDAASNSGAASVGRLQNSLAALQVAAGEKIMAPTTIGIVKVTEATDLLKNNIDNLGKVFVAALLVAGASAVSLGSGIGLLNGTLGFLLKGLTYAAAAIKSFGLQMGIAYGLVEILSTVINSVNDSSPFKSLADDSEAAFAKISKGASLTKQNIEDLKNEIYGKDRNVFQQIGDGISGTFGGQTSITKKADDDTVNADRLLEQNEKALKRKPVELTEANRIRRSEIDLELSVVRSQNANLTSKDRDKIDINNKKEQKLIEERSSLEKPINTRQAELEQVIKNANNIIDSPLRNESEKGLAKLQLAEAEKEQRKLQEQLISSASTLSVGLRKVGEGLQAGLAAIDLASINRKTQTYLAAAQDVRNTGALAQANFVDTTTTLSAKQSLQQQAVGNLKSTIYSPENRSTVQALGIDPESIGQEQIDRLKSTVTDTRGQALLGYLSKYQSVKTELAQTNQSLFEAQYNYLKSIADYNKGSIDQVINLQNRLANLSITARNAISSLQQQVEQTLVEIDTTSSKAAFQAQRNKIQNAYNKFLEKLGISTDDIFEQIFTNYNSILDTVQQLVERRLGRKQTESTAKFRVYNNETRKYQVEQEQRTGIEDLKRQESERRLGNPLNQPQSGSGENQPVNSNPSSGNTSLIRPVESKVNSGFGYRIHPVHGGRKFHAGVDYPVPTGTAIKVAGEGVVTFAGTKGGYGNTVDIKHPSGETTRYGHLSKIGVEVGQRVTQGQQIALSGGAKGAPGSGTSTGPHLHFETRNAKGEAIDPIKRLKNATVAQSVTSQPTIARPNPANGKIEQIAAQNKAQSLIVQEVATGRIVADYNSAVQPVSSASTLKLPIARAIQRAVTDGRLSLDRKVQINPDIVAQGDERMVGKSYSVKQLLSSSIKESNNTSANALIALLGGPDGATAAINQLGFKNSQVGNYFSRPGAKGFNNKTTAADVNKALIEFENSTDPASAIVKQSLRQTPNKFGYKGEVGGKIGNNSKVLGNSGIVDIDGKQYAISQFYETPDSPKARKNLANTTNKIESVISSNRISASRSQSAPTPAVSPTTVTSSTYTPGGGGMNGAEKDSRGNRLTRNDYAIAIPGQNRVKDQIPYGSIVKLNYGGKTVNAKVTDGGPYVPGRQLDMTTAAAKALGFNGVGQVGVSLVSLPKGADPDKKYYFGEATYRPKFGKGGSLSVAEANKAIASVVRGDKYVTLGKGVQAEATNDSQSSNSPPAGKGTLGEAILNNITQQGVDKKIAENEKLSKGYVDSVKIFSDRDSDAGRKKAQQERNLYNQQDESDRTKLDTQILKNQNLLDRNLPAFNRKSVELENQAAAYNRSSNNRDAYQKIDSIYSQYGGIPETATQDTAIVNSQSTIDRLKEESRVRRENLLKQIQSIEAQGAGWAELKKRIQEQVTSLKKNGFTDDATALEDFIVSNDRAIGTPKARQQTIDRLSKQYRALPSDGIAVYDSIAPGANKVLTDNKALNSQYLPKTFDDNLNAEARSIVERFKAAKEALQGEFLKLDEAIGILEAEIQAKLKAAGYAPQKLDLTDPKRLELLNKIAPEQTVVLQQANARRLQLNLSGQNLDRNADTAAARAVSIGQKREQLTVDRANTDYLAATQDGSAFAQIQIDKQRFRQGKTDLDLQFEQGAVSADLYAAKLKQLTLETDTLRNSVLPLRAATKGFFDDAFSGQGVLDGLGNAVKNLALNILKNFQDIISKELGSQLFGSLAAGAGDLQGEAAGGGILGTLFKGLGFNVAGSKPNTNAGLDLGLNSPILPPPSSGGNSGRSFAGFGLNLGLGLLGLPSIPGFATGGMVTSPTLALVGEGINNEAIVPLPNGRSIPVDLRGAGESSGSSVNSSVSVTIQNSGQARETSRGEGQAISQMIKGAVMDVLVNERRAGGLLS